jgi:hypothetical protein
MTFILQSRTDHTDAELAKQGLAFKPAVLAAGASERVGFWRAAKAQFAAWGYDDVWAAAFQAAIDDLVAKAATAGNHDANDTTSAQAASTVHDVEVWVATYLTALTQAPRALAKQAPHPAHDWVASTRLPIEVAKLILFASTHDFAVMKARSAAFAAEGQAKLDAYNAAHQAHTADTTVPETLAMRTAAGLVAFELARLHAAAKHVVPDQATKFRLSPLRSGTHHSGAKTKEAASTPATPAVSKG